MSSAKYRAIVFDFDGTAVPNSLKGRPSPRVVSAISAAQQAGVLCVGATGRPAMLASQTARQLGLDGPVIMGGGTIIYDAKLKQITSRQSIDTSTYPALRRCLPPECTVGAETPTGYAEVSSPELDRLRDADSLYVLALPSATAQLVMENLKAVPDVIGSLAPAWLANHFVVHITPVGATKEHAIAQVLAEAGLSQSQAIGVGDGHNDLHLFNAVGLKVAMGNAVPELIEAADIVTDTVEADGLAEIIESYLLAPVRSA